MNVLVILGHPRTDSLCGALAESFADGARSAGLTVREIRLAELDFDRDVRHEDPTDQELEPDLRAAQEAIQWADHLAFVYPNWWGTMPALLKAFFDRTFTPGFAFAQYDEGEGAGHEELLDDTTAELVVTMDMPAWVYRLIYRRPGTNAIKRATLGYAGVETTRTTYFGPVEDSDRSTRERWLSEATRKGRSLADGPRPPSTRVTDAVSTWLKALRLQFYPMAWVAYTIGALAAAGTATAFSTATYWLGFGFLFFLEATTVLSNEYVDFESDRRNTFAGPFTGGSRVLVDDDLSFRDLRRGIAVTLALTVATGGATLVLADGSALPMAVAMALLSVLALGYTVPPLKFSYRTFGELDVAVTHSVGVLLCGFVFLGGDWADPLPWLLSLPFLLSILPSITLAGIPDREADESAGKETIAVRFGIDSAVTVAKAGAVLAATTAVVLEVVDGLAGAYGPAIYLSVPHTLLLVWLLDRRLEDGSAPRRIDGLMAASLSYVVWFGAVPLLRIA